MQAVLMPENDRIGELLYKLNGLMSISDNISESSFNEMLRDNVKALYAEVNKL